MKFIHVADVHLNSKIDMLGKQKAHQRNERSGMDGQRVEQTIAAKRLQGENALFKRWKAQIHKRTYGENREHPADAIGYTVERKQRKTARKQHISSIRSTTPNTTPFA